MRGPGTRCRPRWTQGRPAAAGHGQCRHRDSAAHGPAGGAALRQHAHRRCLADAPADGARGHAAARHGCAHRHRRRQATGAHPRRGGIAGDRLCAADGQRPGEVRGAAGSPVRAGHEQCHPPPPPPRFWRAHRVRGRPREPRGRTAPARLRHRGPRGFFIGGVFHCGRLSGGPAGPDDPQRRREPDPHRAAGDAAAHGRRHRRAAASRRGARTGRRYPSARRRSARHPRSRGAGTAGHR